MTNEQPHFDNLPFSNEDSENNKESIGDVPGIECDYDFPCQCHDTGLEGEWYWDERNGAWTCSTCRDIQ